MAEILNRSTAAITQEPDLAEPLLSSASQTDTATHQVGVQVLQNLTSRSSEAVIQAQPLAQSNPSLRRESSRVTTFIKRQQVLTTHYASSIQAGGALLDRVGKAAADFATNAPSSDASGGLSGLAMIVSAGLAIKTFVKDVLPQRRQTSYLKQQLTQLQEMQKNPEIADFKKLESSLPKELLPLTSDTLDTVAREIESRLREAQGKLKSSSLKMSTQILGAIVSGANFISKVMHVAGIALKFLGAISGVLILVVGIISLVNNSRALHGTNQQLAKLKDELSVCQGPARQAELKNEIKKLELTRKSQIFAVVMASVEVILGIAFIAANTLSGGAAVPVVMGILAASSLISVVGNYCFSKQVMALQKSTTDQAGAPEAAPNTLQPLREQSSLMQPLLDDVRQQVQQMRS